MAYFTLFSSSKWSCSFYTLANAVLSNVPVLSAVEKKSMVGGEFINIILIFFLIFWTSTPIINKNCSHSVTCVIYNLGKKYFIYSF